MELFLLAGQSNMSGFGDLKAVSPISNERIFSVKEGVATVAKEPLHSEHIRCGVGLAMSFAQAFVTHFPTRSIGLIPTAFSGSSISRWQPDSGDLFGNAIEQCMKALPLGRLSGILWHQGEADATSLKDAQIHQKRLATTLLAFRKQFGEVPFIAGGLGDFLKVHPEFPYANSIDEGIAQLIQQKIHCAYVSATDLTDIGDGVHFDATSLRIFGKRYFDAFLHR